MWEIYNVSDVQTRTCGLLARNWQVILTGQLTKAFNPADVRL
jgi:hypothetical protein